MDPLTASLLFQGAGSLIQGLGDSSAAKKRENLLRGLSDEGKAEIPGLEKKVDQYGIGPSMRKLRQMAAEDPIGDLARQDLQRSKGTAIGALKSGGAKSLFALPATMAGIDRSRRQIDADSFGRTQSALSKVGQAEELVGRAKFNQDVNDLRSARSQALGFELDAERARQQGSDARLGMLTSGLSTLGSLAGAGAFGDGSGGLPKVGVGLSEGDTSFERLMGRSAFPESNQTGYSFMGNYSGLNQNNSPFSAGYDFGYNTDFNMAPPRDYTAGMYRGRLGEFARGGRTKGAFNHDTNDMKIVDKNGSHTGMSVTGDEVVLNPQQQKNIAKQSSYFRSLMKTPNFR